MRKIMMFVMSVPLVFLLFGCGAKTAPPDDSRLDSSQESFVEDSNDNNDSDDKKDKDSNITSSNAGKILDLFDKTKNDLIRYDGLYCYINDYDNDGKINNSVLRFYEDGSVISVGIGQTEDVEDYFPRASWFDKGKSPYIGLGEYELSRSEISFSVTSTTGSVDYWGTVEDDQLILNMHSNINGYEDFDREYKFYSFDDVPGWYDEENS